jgi:hypothetical protein
VLFNNNQPQNQSLLPFQNITGGYNELNSLITNNKKMSFSSEDKGSLLPTTFNNVLDSFLLGDVAFNNQPKFSKTKSNRSFSFLKESFSNNTSLNNLTFVDSFENTRWLKRSSGRNTALRLVKYPFTNNPGNSELFFLRFFFEVS